MRSRQCLKVFACLVLGVGCGKDSSSAGSPKPPTKQDDFARIEKAKKAACASQTAALQVDAPEHVEIVEAINAANEHGFGTDLGPLKELPDISSKIDAVEKEIAQSGPPDKPEKPTYEKPEYSGSWSVVGRCVQNYQDGIVITANGKYFAVLGADACDRDYIRGYVQGTGATVNLEIGRNGREAHVVQVKDRETYVDDQKAYRDELAQATADYQQAVKDYPQQVRAWPGEVAAAERNRRIAESSRDNLAKRWRALLGCPGSSLATATPAGVDPDCYGAGTICNKARVADAEVLDELVGPAIAKAGWKCHEVRYIAGDDGGMDAISINVPANCTTGLDVPPKAHLTQLANTLHHIVAGQPLAKNVDLLQVTDGDAIDVQVPISSSKPRSTPSAATVPTPTAEDTAQTEVRTAQTEVATAVSPRNSGSTDSVGTICDEVSCVLNNYEGACCSKFRKKPTTPTDSTDSADSAKEPSEGLDRGMIAAGLGRVRASAFACGDNSGVTGTVKVFVKVNPDGTVATVTIKETPDAALGTCVASAVQTATFKATKNGASFSYPYSF